MEIVKYYDEDNKQTIEITMKDFIHSEAWHLPYNFVKNEADKSNNIEVKSPLYHQLLRRSKVSPYIDMIKESSFYPTLYQEIVTGDNELDNILLATYFDNDLIESKFNGLNNLTDTIINYKENDVFPSELITLLVKLSELGIDDTIRDKMLDGIDYLVDREIDLMDEISKKYKLPTTSEKEKMFKAEEMKKIYKNQINSNNKQKYA